MYSRFSSGLCCLSIVLGLAACGRAWGSSSSSSNAAAVDALLKQGGESQMLALGERHGSIAEHEFLSALIRDPRFSAVFPIIVVEFGNALYQDAIDRYIDGQNVAPDDLKKVWQCTTVPMAWDSPLYAEFFATVREINRSAPKDHKIRVLLGDPPVDWSKVNSVADFKPYMDRDAFYAEVMTKNCAGQRCLLICGTNHFYWQDPLSEVRGPSAHKGVLEYYLADHGQRNKVQAVLPLFSKAQDFRDANAPQLFSANKPPLMGKRFGQVDQSKVSIQKKVNGKTEVIEVQPENTLMLAQVVDWVLYLGATDHLSPAPAVLYQDKAYVKELYRRDKIVGDAFGFDLTSDVKAVDPDATH